MTEIIERICKSPALITKPTLAGLLRYLAKKGGAAGLTPRQLANARLFESLSEDTVRRECTRLREALEHYFLYCRDGREESEHVDLPAAASDEKGPHEHKRYKLIKRENLHSLRGASAFWWAHFSVLEDDRHYEISPTKIVFTEPLMFRDKKRRLFIRHLDVNDLSNHDGPHFSESDPISALMKQIPWETDRADIVISRGYIPGGEVIAKDSIKRFLSDHIKKIKTTGGHLTVPPIFVEETVSRKVPDINALNNFHCILLGSSRANWVIRYFQRESGNILPIAVEANGITIPHCTSAEYRDMLARLTSLADSGLTKKHLRAMVRRKPNGGVILSEDWSKLSFALVSRARTRDHARRFTITVLAANQGRGIQALGEHILVDDDRVNQVFSTFGIQHPLPKAFQMLFAVVLEDDEAGYSKAQWTPLLYRGVAPSAGTSPKTARLARKRAR